MSPYRPAALAVLLALATAPPTRGEDAAAPRAEPAAGWLPILKRQAADYRIRLDTAERRVATVLPEPILRWSQPVRGGDDGAVFLWVADGRPAAVATVFTYRIPGELRFFQHEVHSLTTAPLDATWRGKPEWHPSKAGVTFVPVPGVAAPDERPPARLRQMQAIARDFAGQSVDRKGATWDLRLMPRPLHRYGAPGSEPLDGALFCLAQGTDPEIFLLIEARQAGPAARWEYALARFSDLKLTAKYRGKAIWDAPFGTGYHPDAVHTYHVVERVDADEPGQYEAAPKSPGLP